MKRWVLSISVALCLLTCLATGGHWIWKNYYSAGQFRVAVKVGIETGDFSRAERLKRWGTDKRLWRSEDSGRQFIWRSGKTALPP